MLIVGLVSLVNEIGVVSVVSMIGVVYVGYEVGLVSAIIIIIIIIKKTLLTCQMPNLTHTVCKLIADTYRQLFD